MAFSLAPGAYAASLNGGAAQTAALSTLYQPSPATVYLGSDGTSAGSINGHLKQAAIYPTALTNAQLQAITSADPAHLAYPTLSLISDPSTQPSIGTYTRSSTATYTGSDGLLHTAASGVLRYDYSPTVVDSNTGGLKGLVWLFEEARTRLNTISAAPSAPENVTVTAQAYTLSFYGTGTMTLSGAYSGSAVGTGAYPSRKALTFTPSAGTLTLTPSGSITNLQLEAGAFATSVMMGEGSTVTRAADVWTIPTASFPFNASEGTLYAWFDTLLPTSHTGNMTVALLSDNSSSNYVQIAAGWYNNTSQSYIISGVSGSDLLSKQWLPGVQYKAGVSYKSGAWKGSVNGAAPITAATASVPTMTRLDVGQGLGGAQLNGHIIRLDYIPKGDSNADLQLRTSALETGENEYAMAA